MAILSLAFLFFVLVNIDFTQSQNCPNGFALYGGICRRYWGNNRQFDSAEWRCRVEDNGLVLSGVISLTQLDQICRMMRAIPMTTSWTSLSQRNGNWYWPNGDLFDATPFGSRWDTSSGGTCARLMCPTTGDASLKTSDCNVFSEFLCEYGNAGTVACFDEFPGLHVSYGFKQNVVTQKDCSDTCRASSLCEGFDYNYDPQPYQDSPCWHHTKTTMSQDRIEADMNVTHFARIPGIKVCEAR